MMKTCKLCGEEYSFSHFSCGMRLKSLDEYYANKYLGYDPVLTRDLRERMDPGMIHRDNMGLIDRVGPKPIGPG